MSATEEQIYAFEIVITDEIVKMFEKTGRSLADSSLKKYSEDIIRLLKKVGFFDDGDFSPGEHLEEMKEVFRDVYRDPADLMKKLGSIGIQTKRNYCSAVITLLQCGPTFDEGHPEYGNYSTKTLNAYLEERKRLNVEYANSKALVGQGMTSGQKANMATQDEIREVIQNLETRNAPRKKDEIMMQRQMIVLLKLYQRIPARNEFATLVYSDDDMAPESISASGNTIHHHKGGWVDGVWVVPTMEINLRDYKTKTHHGDRHILISQDSEWGRGMIEAIKNLAMTGHIKEPADSPKAPRPLFMKNFKTMNPLDNNGLSKLLSAFFKKELNKKISTTILAKSLYQETIGQSVSEQLRALCLARGHSLGTALTHYC
mgnify:FL=1